MKHLKKMSVSLVTMSLLSSFSIAAYCDSTSTLSIYGQLSRDIKFVGQEQNEVATTLTSSEGLTAEVIVIDNREAVLGFIQALEAHGLQVMQSHLTPFNLFLNNDNKKLSPGELVMLVSEKSFKDSFCLIKFDTKWIFQSDYQKMICLDENLCLNPGSTTDCFVRPVPVIESDASETDQHRSNTETTFQVTLFEANQSTPPGVEFLCHNSNAIYSFMITD